MRLLLLTAAFLANTSHAFVVTPRSTKSNALQQGTNRPVFVSSSSSITTLLSASTIGLLNQLADITFNVSVKKPMGVIFGENPSPMLGLVIDDVSPGLNGGAAGLRNGDQLVAVNGQVVVGRDFDSVMNLLQQTSSHDDGSQRLQLTMFRGVAVDLYAAVASLTGGDDEESEYLEPEDVVVIDENYEAPRVVFESVEEKPLTVGRVLNIFKKMADTGAAAAEQGGEPKKKGGLFGGMFGGETIQLDGNDASTVK